MKNHFPGKLFSPQSNTTLVKKGHGFLMIPSIQLVPAIYIVNNTQRKKRKKGSKNQIEATTPFTISDWWK